MTKIKENKFFEETQYVDGVPYTCKLCDIEHTDLEFWLDNPRFYETIRKEFGDQDILQEDIYPFLLARLVKYYHPYFFYLE